MFSFIYNAVGLFGDACVLVAYTLLHFHKLRAHSFIYSLLNFFGAALVLVSLCFEWNLPSAFIESAWVLISLYGLFKYRKNKL